MADCVLLAAAQLSGGAIATADRPVARAARSESIGVVLLPTRGGRSS